MLPSSHDAQSGSGKQRVGSSRLRLSPQRQLVPGLPEAFEGSASKVHPELDLQNVAIRGLCRKCRTFNTSSTKNVSLKPVLKWACLTACVGTSWSLPRLLDMASTSSQNWSRRKPSLPSNRGKGSSIQQHYDMGTSIYLYLSAICVLVTFPYSS